MTTNEAIDQFSVLQDQYGSPNFSDTETLQFLNSAQNERLKRLLPDDQGGVVNLELDENVLFNVRPLIFPISTTMSSGGVITFSAVNTALRTASGDSTCNIHRILNIGWTKSAVAYPTKFVKHNNWYSYKRNVFKTGAATQPNYMVDATNLTFDPIDTAATITVTCLKTPKIMEAGNTPDWDNSNMDLIIQIALGLAFESTRDAEGIQAQQAINVAK